MSNTENMTPYDLLGGEIVLKQLVERFYLYMDTLPETQTIRHLHAKNLHSAQLKLYKFLSGWLGGPSLYMQEYGHPRLKRRHFPFAIGHSEKTQWMLCMNKSLDDMAIDSRLREQLREALDQLSTHMINKQE